MKEDVLIGGGLVMVGMMLELSVGPVVWDAFRWPVNGIVLAGFLAFPANPHTPASSRPVGPAHFVCPLADVLVGHQLPAFRPRFQRACLQSAGEIGFIFRY